MSDSSVSQNAMNVKLEEIRVHREAKRVRKWDQGAKIAIWLATGLVAVTALALGAWSNQTVAQWLGVKGLAGWGAALVIDGIWLVSLAIVQLYRKEPWRALAAYQATVAMVILSASTNFAHGLIRFGLTWRGGAAGLLFALLPVGLKWLVSVSTRNTMGQLLKAPDAKNRIKQAGQITAEYQLDQLLRPVGLLLAGEPEPERVEIERVAQPEPEPVKWYNQPGLNRDPLPPLVAPVQVEAPPVATTGALTTRKARVDDLARVIAERGGQLSSVSFADIKDRYGIEAKATASNLRKDAHKAYLEGAQTGMYL